MRPIEKRLAAVEARRLPQSSGNMRVFTQPDGVDPDAFERQCRDEAAGAEFRILVFVDPREHRLQ